MPSNQLLWILLLVLISGCGGGGGGGSSQPNDDPNNTPTAANDAISLIEDTPTTIDVTNNDSDSDGTLASVSIVSNSTNGVTGINGLSVIYTPDTDFSGSDSFTYTVTDNDGATSAPATVSITVSPIITTSISVIELTIPTTNYNILNNAELSTDVLTSPNQTLTLPPNTISFALSLLGEYAFDSAGSLFISGLIDSDNITLTPLTKQVTFCESGLCTALIPKKPGPALGPGQWQYNLGTLDGTLANIDLQTLNLRATIRTGPTPDLAADFPVRLKVRPFVTSTSIDNALLTQVLDEFVQIASANMIAITMLPITRVTDGRFNEVSKFFTDTDTADLVRLGDSDAINLFFIEGFSGFASNGTLGIASGIPGTLGIKSSHNGVLIDATANRTNSTSVDPFYTQSTAKVAFHEAGHFLGLFHTTEADFSGEDILADTLVCQLDPDDLNGNRNGIADLSECPDSNNIMFWNIDFNQAQEPLTDDQRQVIINSPIAEPAN